MRARYALFLIIPIIAILIPLGNILLEDQTILGDVQEMGKGTIRSFIVVENGGKPKATGVVFKESALAGLPETPSKKGRCLDRDGNGRIDDAGECKGDYEFRLPLPETKSETGLPFKWIGVNWNPLGHPPKPWSTPHFDFHFYMTDQAAIDAIRVGPCDFFINCDDRKRARKPVPAQYVHPEHIEVGATVSMMGNHLIDSKTPELAKTNATPFTHSWIFGAYDGEITFYEPMITRAYLLSRPESCFPIKAPEAWARAGHYPTTYCIRYLPDRGVYTITLEDMVYREAS